MNPELATIEDSLLGAVMLDSRQFSDAAQIVDPGDFASEWRGNVWKTIAAMMAEGVAVDTVTVAGRSGADKKALLASVDACALASHAPDYAREVRLEADRRAVSRQAYDLHHLAKDADDPVGLAVTMAGGLRSRERRSASSLGDLLAERYETLTTPREFATFPLFSTVHLHFGDMFVIGSRRGIGKSALAAQVSDEWSQVYPTRIYSLEMSRYDWADRYITRHAGVTTNELDDGLAEDRADMVRLLTSDLHARQLDIADHIAGVDAMIADLRRFAADGGRVAIIDYLGLLVAKERGESRYEAVTDASRKLKLCALSTGLLLVVLSQLSRKTDPTGKERQPSMSDLRDSGAVEQDADGVLLLHRYATGDTAVRERFTADDYDLSSPWADDTSDLAQFDFAKLRRGECFRVPMWWSGPAQNFRRVDKRYRP